MQALGLRYKLQRPGTQICARPPSLRSGYAPRSLVVECRRTSSPKRPSFPAKRNQRPRRRQQRGSAREQLGIMINHEIRYSTVRLLDSSKEMLGVFPIKEAMNMARRLGVDLVLQNAATDPPLCRLIEWSKYKYEIEKRNRLARQKQRAARIDQKELKMRPSTDVHDYQVRLRKAIEEIGRGNHVKIVVQYRGREIQNKEEGEGLLKRFVKDVGDRAVIEKAAAMEGRRLTLTLAPNKT